MEKIETEYVLHYIRRLFSLYCFNKMYKKYSCLFKESYWNKVDFRNITQTKSGDL